MNTSKPPRAGRSRLNLIGAVILVAGLSVSGTLLQLAGNSAADASGVQEVAVGDKIYAVPVGDPAIRREDLEHAGGQLSVLAGEFSRWVHGLANLENLAYLIAVLSLAAAVACFWRGQAAAGSEEIDPRK